MVTFDDLVKIDDIQDDKLGGSITLEPNMVTDGALIFDDNQIIGSIDPTITGGFRIDTWGNAQELSMEESLESLGFDYDNVRMPWDQDPNIVGTPEIDSVYWQPQTTEFTCAVQAQRGIIEMYTGEDVSESQLVYDAVTNGWLTDQGMSPYDVGNLLEMHGIPCHANESATIQDLISELAAGRKVIVGVDSGELWQGEPLEDFFHEKADHAIWVTGIDLTDPDNPMVIINDSGEPNGAGRAYLLETFMDSWEDSGFYYVATDYAPHTDSMDWSEQLASFLQKRDLAMNLEQLTLDDTAQDLQIDFARYMDSLSDSDIDRLLMYL